MHSIDSMVSRMATDAGLDVTKKHFTNHSIRKTVKKLKEAGVSVTEIMAITGHKNQQSRKASVGMYSRYDYLLFVYFLILPSLLHSSILFNCFFILLI